LFLSDRLEDELDRSSHHASTNVDLHVYTQRLESECHDLRSQITMREKEKFELNEMIADFEGQVSILNNPSPHSRNANLYNVVSYNNALSFVDQTST
jgi:predicted nuclease with TOPRIM domain